MARVLPRLLQAYRQKVMPDLMKEFSYRNTMQVPRLQKIVVNIGMGEGSRDAKLIDAAVQDLAAITGQKPSVRRARVSVANFKLREGMPVGCAVTLRGDRMWEFMDRLVSTAIPRIRDFRGIPTRSFDGRGNYSLGIKEHTVFTEIDYDKIARLMGMDVTFVTSAKSDEEARRLLALIGLPFQES